MTDIAKKHIKRLKITVTQKEIEEAHLAKSNGCMIQQAIKRDYPEFTNIWVDKSQIRFTDPKLNCIYTFQMNPRGRVMILKWDAGETILPFDFQVRDPIIRERTERSPKNYPKVPRKVSDSTRSLGAVPIPKTKEARLQSGRDRVFGSKRWHDELEHLRNTLLPERQVQTGEIS